MQGSTEELADVVCILMWVHAEVFTVATAVEHMGGDIHSSALLRASKHGLHVMCARTLSA